MKYAGLGSRLDNPSVIPHPTLDGPQAIRKRLLEIIRRLKNKGLWKYIDPLTKSWLELAARLRSLKFRSQLTINVLMKVLKQIKPLLSLADILRNIGIRFAWENSYIATSWGNKDACNWRNDKAYQIYCGALALQISRITPGMDIFEIPSISKLNWRGAAKILRKIRRYT